MGSWGCEYVGLEEKHWRRSVQSGIEKLDVLKGELENWINVGGRPPSLIIVGRVVQA